MSILQQGLGSYLSPLRDALGISSRWVLDISENGCRDVALLRLYKVSG